MIIGIDIGGSTTDIVGFSDGHVLFPLTVKASDPISSAAGSLGRYLSETNKQLSDISILAITGVGAGALGPSLLGIPVTSVDEFQAIGYGGVYLTGYKEAIVASIGTGTAIVEVDEGRIAHWGGTGVGGGTLMGLCKALFGISDIGMIMKRAENGQIEKVDLSVGDIATKDIPGLPPSTTAANFARMSDDAVEDDYLAAVINLICQTVGLITAGAARATGKDNVILIGKLVSFPMTRKIFDRLASLTKINYISAPDAAFATAVGAAVAAAETL